MKKIIYVLIIVLLITGCSSEKVKTKTSNNKEHKKSILNHEYYKGLKLENILSIDELKYKESGLEEKTYTEKEDIERIYNYWKKKKLGKKTNMSCDDNTTIYIFKLEENVSLSIEQECDWVIINNKRYLID